MLHRSRGSRRIAPLVLGLALFANVAAAEVQKELNVVYGKGGDRDLQLDLVRPEGEGPFPAIVFIHGGGWRNGSRAGHLAGATQAAERGYLGATISYRLTEAGKDDKAKFPFPAQVHDVKCAIRWLRANAEKYKVDPNRIGAIGDSAGGHLSLMLGLTDPKAKLEGDGGHTDQSSRVQAVVNYYGPTDMIRMAETSPGAAPIVASFLGGAPDQAREAYLASSPLTYVTKDAPPILTLHGDEDQLVPLEQAKLLDAKMKEVGASHTLRVIEGQGHGFPREAGQRARTAMFEFFDKHLKPAKAK